MKFQIILEAIDPKKAQMPCDEFEKLVKRQVKLPGFQVISGQNLDGLKPEVWKTEKQMKVEEKKMVEILLKRPIPEPPTILKQKLKAQEQLTRRYKDILDD